jgi:hypothetical protein
MLLSSVRFMYMAVMRIGDHVEPVSLHVSHLLKELTKNEKPAIYHLRPPPWYAC